MDMEGTVMNASTMNTVGFGGEVDDTKSKIGKHEQTMVNEKPLGYGEADENWHNQTLIHQKGTTMLPNSFGIKT